MYLLCGFYIFGRKGGLLAMPRMSKKRKQEWALLKRIKLLSARIDSLTDENKTLNNKLDSTKNELVQYKNDNKLLKIRLDDVKEQNSVLQTKVNDHNHSILTMSKKLNIPWWRSHPIHENRATLSICTEPCSPLLRATKSTKRVTSNKSSYSHSLMVVNKNSSKINRSTLESFFIYFL